MKYKNVNLGLTGLFIAFLLFCCQHARAHSHHYNYNEDIRHSLYTLPIIDHYGITGELAIDELNRYQRNPESGKITPMVWYEAIIHIPHWVKHARYCDYCSEIPVFENLKAYASPLRVQVKPARHLPEDQITLRTSSDYSYKEFTTSRTSLPRLPKEQSHITKEMMTILLGANPIMLREFDTDSYSRWAWVDNLTGSWFEKQPIKIMAHSNPKVLKINPGDHYRMAIIMDDNNEPEAVLLDDAQGAFRRKSYNYFSPIYYGANAFELLHHGKQSLMFGAGTFSKKTISKMDRLANAAFLGHNLFEFAEHMGHLQVVQKCWKSFNGECSTDASEDKMENGEEYEPDYILGCMDVGNLVSTAGELAYQLPLGPWALLENTFSLGIGIVNLLVSSNQKSLIEGFDNRIDDMINRYFENNQRELYMQYRDML